MVVRYSRSGYHFLPISAEEQRGPYTSIIVLMGGWTNELWNDVPPNAWAA